MPLLLFSDGRKQYVLRRISTGEVLKRNARYPTTEDDGPISGLDPDLEYLAMDQDLTPDYDPRVFDLVTSENRQAGTPPLWRITFSTQRRPNQDIKTAVTDKEALEVYNHMQQRERDKLFMLCIGTIFRQATSLTLTAREQAVRDRAIAVSAKLWKNDENVAALFAAIDAGQTPNIDSGWEPAE